MGEAIWLVILGAALVMLAAIGCELAGERNALARLGRVAIFFTGALIGVLVLIVFTCGMLVWRLLSLPGHVLGFGKTARE